jgi:DNA polymerase
LMPLELDSRQRAMLLEMGVRVWLPDAELVQPVVTGPATRSFPVGAPAPEMPAPRAVDTARPVMTDTSNARLDGLGWRELTAATAVCDACALCAGRKRSTLVAPASRAGSAGAMEQHLHADWMVLGDPPDEDEDAAGSAFAQASGVLLANMLKAVGVRRLNPSELAAPDAGGALTPAGVAAACAAYVTNVVKCRPPHGAMVQAAELAKCEAYLQREIALTRPKIILAMGRFANQLVLRETPELAGMPLGKLRGRVYRYQGIPVVVTYHPKTLMRNSADKGKAWADLCLAADTLASPRP